MRLLGGMHVSLLFLALVSMVPVIEAEQSWGVLLVAALAAVLSCLFYRGSGGRSLPRSAMYVPVLAAVGYLVYEMFYEDATTVHIIDLAHFIIFLACCKFFELRTYRDAGLIALISFLLMVIAALVSASPLFGIACVIDMTLGIGWLMAFHTGRERDAVRARRRAALAGAAGSVPPDVGPEEECARPGIVRPVVACSVALGVIAAAVFVFAPRGWEGGLFGRIRALVAVTGFNDVVRITASEIYEDESPVMRVRFTRGGEAITDGSFQAYMRGLTFDRYFGRRWNRTPTKYRLQADAGPVDAPGQLFAIPADLGPEDVIRQEVWLESLGSGTLFAMYPPLAFGSRDIGQVEVDREDHVLRTRSSSGGSAHYTVLSPWRLTRGLTRRLARLPSGPRDGVSQIPPAIERFARAFVARLGSPADLDQHGFLADQICRFLRSDAFEYTLHRGAMPANADPIEDFLLKNRRGHCEFFASAMTLMCQAVGIRARLVSGYHGGEYNAGGGFFQFRRRDAHAWVEVFVPGRGWVRFDPTPPSGREHRRGDESLYARVRQFLNLLQFKWSTLVVSFDRAEREALAGGVRRWFTKLTETDGRPKSLSATVEALLWGPELPSIWLRVLYWLLLVLFFTFGVLTLRVLWILYLMLREYLPSKRSRHPRLARRAEAKFYDRILLLLAHKGHVKVRHATPREFAETLARSHPELAELPELTEWFYEAQYAGRPLGERRWDRVRSFLQRLREDPSFGAG